MEELLKKMHNWMDDYMARFVTDDEEVMQMAERIIRIEDGKVTGDSDEK